ncbi:transposase [Elysia marginata]|uniref:Transposase n=1 Tax=Elysia marginata TaxID=1093978 RepID=A0AAV4H3E9_9GAST|nr:transposase [Elysia marginata]
MKQGPQLSHCGELGIQVMPHPAYSPVLAPCDFWFFPNLKDRLAGRKFDRIQDLAKAVNSEPRTIPEEDYQGVFRKWQIRSAVALVTIADNNIHIIIVIVIITVRVITTE